MIDITSNGAEMGELAVVRTYMSEQEIRDEPGFKEDNPVCKDNYARIIGDYRLPELIRCCIQKKSGAGLCRQGHNYGFVVRLLDDSVSIIGNKCGKTQFDAESKVARDMALYTNLKRRHEALGRVAELLSGKDQALTRLRELRASLQAASSRVDAYRQTFGESCGNQLSTLAQGGTGAVIVMGERVRFDEDGTRAYDPSDRFAIPAGTLKGIAVFRPGQFRSAQDELRKVARAFDKAEETDGNEKTAELMRITADIADFPRVVELCEDLLKAEQDFATCDWSPLPFLVRDVSDQYKLARIARAQAGHPGGKDAAKIWLQAMERTLKAQHGVDRLARAY